MLSAVEKLIIGFVGLIIGLALIPQIAITTNGVTGLTAATDTVNIAGARLPGGGALNESYTFTIANALTTGTWKADESECEVFPITLKNQSGATMTDPTHYVYVTGPGTFTLKNHASLNQSGSNTTTVSYDYCPADYIAVSWGRSVLSLVVGFFALSILGVSLFIFYSVAKDAGIL